MALSGVAAASTPMMVEENAIPLEDFDHYYKVNDGRKRIAVIFNHLMFDKHLKKSARKGTNLDGIRVKDILKQLRFDTSKYYKDPKLNTIVKTLETVGSMKADEVCCIAVVVMTHGGANEVLYAKNSKYQKKLLIDPFLKSKSLVGVPKLFFIQACRGSKKDVGKEVEVDGDDNNDDSISQKFHTHADFLMMYSTVDDHVAWRDERKGTWFIQSLCDELEKAARPGHVWDLLQMLVFVNSKVTGFKTPSGEKQIPQIETTMTKLLKFSD